jgi:glyoxylase-like metal-dependent hydrolase (beta-lactamase superfamily II)
LSPEGRTGIMEGRASLPTPHRLSHASEDPFMNKILQTLHAAEFERFVRGQPGALENLESRLLPLFRQHFLRVDVPQIQRRVRSLMELPAHPPIDSHYLLTFGVRGVVRYPVRQGEVIYKIPVFSFEMNAWKDHWTAAYLVVGRHSLTLVDPGTHLSEASLREGLEVVGAVYGQPLRLEDIEHVVITHAHFDHFGGLSYLLPATRARVWVHEWDAHTISHYPAEVVQGQQHIARFLRQSGMPEADVGTYMKMHDEGKQDFPGFPVQQAFVDGERIIEGYEVIHTPGHCPGLSCLRIGDLMLLGDHVLNAVTPHQFPKIYTSGSGLKNYLNSLIKIASRSEGMRLGLPSHYGDVADIEGRALEIMNDHNQRLADLFKDLARPRTLMEITDDYFRYRRGRELAGYEQLLALEEIGAHMEYLMETLGIVRIAGENGGAGAEEGVLYYEKVA